MAEPTFLPAKVDQVGMVVRDLRQAMAHYVNVLGIGPWRVYTYGPSLVRRRILRNEPGEFELYLAFCQTPTVMLELIEPRGGASLHAEFLAKHGEGIHHYGMFVPSLEEGIAKARHAGFEVLMSGHGTGVDGDGGFAYVGTEDSLATLFELIEAPARRYPPEEIFGG